MLDKLSINYKIIEKALIASLTMKAWASISALFTIYIATKFFNDTNLGKFYGIYSLVILIQFFDLGLNTRIIQVFARKTEVKSENIEIKNNYYLSHGIIKIRIYSILYTSVVLILLYPVEIIPLEPIIKLYVLLSLTASAFLTLHSNIRLSAIEGCGLVYEASFIKLRGAIFGSITLWLAIFFDLGYTSILLATTLSSFYIWATTIRLIKEDRESLSGNIKWLEKEQIQLSITNFSSYATLHLPTLILAQNGYITDAGKAGITFQVIGAITGFSITLHSTKLFQYCSLYKNRMFEQHATLHNKTSIHSWVFLIVLFSGLFGGYALNIEAIVNVLTRADIINRTYVFLIIIITLHYWNKESIYLQSAGGDSAYKISFFRIVIIFISAFIAKQFTQLDLHEFIYNIYVAVMLISVSIINKLTKAFSKEILSKV